MHLIRSLTISLTYNLHNIKQKLKKKKQLYHQSAKVEKLMKIINLGNLS